jgi:hypothetical protein
LEEQITTQDAFAQALAASYGEDQPEAEEQIEDNGQPETDPQSDDQPEHVEDEAEQEPTEEGEQPEDPASLDDKVVTWETAAGEKFEVPVMELKQGYMRDQDYRHKTQSLAKDRETFQQDIEQQHGFVQKYAEDFGKLYSLEGQVKQYEAALQGFDRHNDPVTYNTLVNDLLMLQRERDGVAGRIQQYQQFRGNEERKATAEAQKVAFQELTGPNGIPGFNRDVVQKMSSAAKEYGLSDEDMYGLTDPRALRILHDAMRFREIQAKKPEAVKQVKAAPAKAKPTTSNPPSNVERDMKALKGAPTKENFARMLAHQYESQRKR